MAIINFNNKTFSLVQNSTAGSAGTETKFNYKQEGNMVTADYYGGIIRYGKIIAILKENKLDMLYQCLTVSNELKAGKAMADISVLDDGKLKLQLNWEWLGDNGEKGISEYIEN